jgi:endonuclease IV
LFAHGYAGAGNIIGSTFKDIAGIIALVEDKSRVGVCFDTCTHVFPPSPSLADDCAGFGVCFQVTLMLRYA